MKYWLQLSDSTCLRSNTNRLLQHHFAKQNFLTFSSGANDNPSIHHDRILLSLKEPRLSVGSAIFSSALIPYNIHTWLLREGPVTSCSDESRPQALFPHKIPNNDLEPFAVSFFHSSVSSFLFCSVYVIQFCLNFWKNRSVAAKRPTQLFSELLTFCYFPGSGKIKFSIHSFFCPVDSQSMFTVYVVYTN